MSEQFDCPDCGGDGFTVESDMECCGRSDWECGARGCTGPEPVPVQVPCASCQATGKVSA